MKKVTKIMGIIMLAIIMLQTNVKAFTVDEKTAIDVTKSGYLPIHYIGEEKQEYEILKYEDEPVYALKRGNDNNVVMSFAYQYNNSKLQDILFNGYPAKTYEELGVESEEEAYFATQEAIFVYKEGKDISMYIAENEQGERILKCMEKILNSTKEEKIELVEVDTEWKQLETISSYFYKTYYVSSNVDIESVELYSYEDAYFYSLNNERIDSIKVGQEFKIAIPGYADESQEIYIKFNNESYKMYYMFNRPNTEKSYIMLKYEKSDEELHYSINRNNLTSVTITNYDAKTNEIISGNAFSIYDESGKMIRKNFVTDENGVLNFEFEEGKYYVKQAKVIDGYSIMGGTICFNVKNGSEVNLNIYNMPTEETKEVINKSTSQINVTEETKNIEENDVEDITNIKTTNIVKELTKQTNITNFANNNYITNTTYKKNINNVSQNNKYDNSIWVESLNSYTVDGKSETSNMTREEYMTYIDFITSANAEVPSLPSAVK